MKANQIKTIKYKPSASVSVAALSDYVISIAQDGNDDLTDYLIAGVIACVSGASGCVIRGYDFESKKLYGRNLENTAKTIGTTNTVLTAIYIKA